MAGDRASDGLTAAELERQALDARLVGRDVEAVALWSRAHHAYLEQNDAESAARVAFWVGFNLMFQGRGAESGGWVARARRVLDDANCECVVRGYLLLPDAVLANRRDEPDASLAAFTGALAIGERYGDMDLVAFARMGQGRARIRRGEIAAGVALLDEVMISGMAGEISTPVVGDIYCSVLEACREIFDLRRAQEWTEALHRWCESQPVLVAHRGQCMVQRAEIMQLHGAWPDAVAEIARACERLTDRPRAGNAGLAFYRRGELHRLHGEFAEAEEAYRQASACGKTAQPGLALVRLAQGQREAARAAVAGALAEPHDRPKHASLLDASVEISLALGDVLAARTAAEELAAMAAPLDSPYLNALAAQGIGAVRLAEGDGRGALGILREAATAWRELDAPYEAARVSEQLAHAHRALGDAGTAAVELDAARSTYERLGARPDLARLTETVSKPVVTSLTGREQEVLRLVATGRTNRAIADTLSISEKTVARHVANIFAKLSLTSRAAATAYAFRHGLA